ncbi:MAG: Maf family protein [Halothiobacillus sp.]|mgnify:CR=1 FL=1
MSNLLGAPKAPAALFLASSSPRRAQLLKDMGFRFTVLNAALCAVDETPKPFESPIALVERLAQAKAIKGLQASCLAQGGVVLSGDTVVIHAQRLMGKPRDAADACAMLSQLQGATHEVVTAIAVVSATQCRVISVATQVTLAPLTAAQIAAYVATGEPRDKAGAYALQGMAAQFVQKIEGSWGAVVGLPQFETAQLLAAFAIKPIWLQS